MKVRPGLLCSMSGSREAELQRAEVQVQAARVLEVADTIENRKYRSEIIGVVTAIIGGLFRTSGHWSQDREENDESAAAQRKDTPRS